jgi:DNA polymerase-3 subunit delta'
MRSPRREPIESSLTDSPLVEDPTFIVEHHQEQLLLLMQHFQKRGSLPPVLLFTGQSGIGKRTLTHYLAQWVLCEHREISSSFSPCLKCASCLKVLGSNHVDLVEVLPDTEVAAEKSNAPLKIDQFRKFKNYLGFGAYDRADKVIIIPQAERMTIQAANSVLKLFEEPPPHWIFFLTANDSTLLLPTIVSRCQNIRLKPFSSQKIESFLNANKKSSDSKGFANKDEERNQICAQLAQGSLTRALLFSEDKIWEQRKLILKFLVEPHLYLSALVDWAAQEELHFDALMDLLEQLTAELIHWSVTADQICAENYPWIQTDGKKEICSHIEKLFHQKLSQRTRSLEQMRSFWMAQAEHLAAARKNRFLPFNRKLLIQDFLLPWLIQ